MGTLEGDAAAGRGWPDDVLEALESISETWPPRIRPLRGRRFTSKEAMAVLRAVHAAYDWTARACYASFSDIADEAGLDEPAATAVLTWLVFEERLLFVGVELAYHLNTKTIGVAQAVLRQTNRVQRIGARP